MLRSADVFMIGQFLYNTDVHAGIDQFGNKQMPSQVARTLNVKFPVNRSKHAADAGAVIGLYWIDSHDKAVYHPKDFLMFSIGLFRLQSY